MYRAPLYTMVCPVDGVEFTTSNRSSNTVAPTPPPVALRVVPTIVRLVPKVISAYGIPEPADPAPSNILLAAALAILAKVTAELLIFTVVTALLAIVVAKEPVPDPVTSAVNVIVWSPVLVPEAVPPPITIVPDASGAVKVLTVPVVIADELSLNCLVTSESSCIDNTDAFILIVGNE